MQILVRNLHFLRAAIRARAVAAVARRFARFGIRRVWLFMLRGCGIRLLAEHRAGLLRAPRAHQSFRHRMHRRLQLLAVRLVQWFPHGAVDDPVQFIDIHIDPRA